MDFIYNVLKMNEPDWNQVEAVPLTHTGWLTPCSITAKAQVCYNDEKIWLQMESHEKPIRATLTGVLDSICKDSCLEFFFAPLLNDDRYFNFEFNPLGTMLLGYGKKRETRIRQIPNDSEKLFCPKPFLYEEGWGITFQIPLSFIRIYFPEYSFSNVGCCNFYKCGELTETPHYLAWAPLTTDKPDYHRRQDFGILRFR